MKYVLALVLMFTAVARADTLHVGSKAFTESVILGNIATQLGNEAGVATEHRPELGGTTVLWKALIRGEIDAYPEYTGTLTQELFKDLKLTDDESLRAALANQGIGMSQPIGFNDSYAIGMLETTAARLGIKTISDLRSHPELRFGLSNEFLDRQDGWPALRARYALPQTNVNGVEHNLSYRAIAANSTDVIDLYSTDAEIAFYKLRALEDDKKLFPDYQAVFLYRLDLKQRSPLFLKSLERLDGAIAASQMIAMNARAKLDKVDEKIVAADFLDSALHIKVNAQAVSLPQQLLTWTLQHLLMVGLSLAASILVGVPLGVLAFTSPAAGRAILGIVAAIYTIPALALLAFMIPLPIIGGLGTTPAVVALFLYGLLPIVRNTHAGLAGIPAGLRESARVLGLPSFARLWHIDLPMAMPAVLAGVQTAAVINVGTATIGALIGAGGYGQPILTGIRLADTRLILLGAIPAAVLALLVQSAFGLLGRYLIPRGMRLKPRD